VILTVIVVPVVVLLAIGRPDGDTRAPRRVEPSTPEGELPEILRRPLRAGRAA
jgi:hypothetical protein